MDKSVALILRGFMELTDAQRATLIAEINKYQNAKPSERQMLTETLRKSVQGSTIQFGPAPIGCPCCGK